MKDRIARILAVASLTLLVGACGTYSTTDRNHARSSSRVYGASAPAPGHETICHKGKKTMSLPSSAIPAHINHGDHRGHC